MNLFKPDMTMLLGLLTGMYAVPWILAKVNK